MKREIIFQREKSRESRGTSWADVLTCKAKGDADSGTSGLWWGWEVSPLAWLSHTDLDLRSWNQPGWLSCGHWPWTRDLHQPELLLLLVTAANCPPPTPTGLWFQHPSIHTVLFPLSQSCWPVPSSPIYPNSPEGWGPSFPFHGGHKWSSERLRHLPKATQIWAQVCGAQAWTLGDWDLRTWRKGPGSGSVKQPLERVNWVMEHRSVCPQWSRQAGPSKNWASKFFLLECQIVRSWWESLGCPGTARTGGKAVRKNTEHHMWQMVTLPPSPHALLEPGNYLFKAWNLGASLVAEWIRIHLPMQWTQLWSLVWEDSTYCKATMPVSHSYWSLCAWSLSSATREATTSQLKSSPHSLQLKKPLRKNKPSIAKSKTES